MRQNVSSAVNPIKRMRKNLHLTIDQVCQQAGVSKSLVIKNEQGMYPLPSATLLRFFRRELRYRGEQVFATKDLFAEYRDWQRIHRQSCLGILDEDFDLDAYLFRLPVGGRAFGGQPGEPYPHPLEYWRLSSAQKPNLNMISKAFCLNQSLLFKFEQQPYLVNSVPEPIRSALLESGYSQAVLARFELAYLEFKRYLRNLGAVELDADGHSITTAELL